MVWKTALHAISPDEAKSTEEKNKTKKIRASLKDEETERLAVFPTILHTSRDENTSCKESAEEKPSPIQASASNNPVTVTVR